MKPAQKTHRIGAPSGDHGAPGGLETLSPVRYDPKKALKQQTPQYAGPHQVNNQLPSGSTGNRVGGLFGQSRALKKAGGASDTHRSLGSLTSLSKSKERNLKQGGVSNLNVDLRDVEVGADQN